METFAIPSMDGIALDVSVHSSCAAEHRGIVVHVHGITATKDEGGLFVRNAEQLCDAGFSAIRFSFRGHGASGGTPRGVTIAGELMDVQTVVRYAADRWSGPLFVVAASFGAVSTVVSLDALSPLVSGLVLWNPVLDLRATFLAPTLPWGVRNFNSDRQAELRKTGVLTMDNGFEINPILFQEFEIYRPDIAFTDSDIPALVVHGDRDAAVPYSVAHDLATRRARTQFHQLSGANHGFGDIESRDGALRITRQWLLARNDI